MGLGVLILEMCGVWLAGISSRAAFLIYLVGIVIQPGVLLTMKEPVLPTIVQSTLVPDETFPMVPLLFGYATLFLGSIRFFLMPIKFPYQIASSDAARLLGKHRSHERTLPGAHGLRRVSRWDPLREDRWKGQPKRNPDPHLCPLRDRVR